VSDGHGGTATANVTVTVTGVNDAPTLANPLADQSAAPNTAFLFQFAANTFNDIDPGDTLTYSATLQDGSALPAWLQFDAATRTFSGTPGPADESIDVKVTATDSHNASVSDTFTLTLPPHNHAPVLTSPAPVGEVLTKTQAIERVHAPAWLKDQLRARRRGQPVASPRGRTALIAWQDARRTVASARRAAPD